METIKVTFQAQGSSHSVELPEFSTIADFITKAESSLSTPERPLNFDNMDVFYEGRPALRENFDKVQLRNGDVVVATQSKHSQA